MIIEVDGTVASMVLIKEIGTKEKCFYWAKPFLSLLSSGAWPPHQRQRAYKEDIS